MPVDERRLVDQLWDQAYDDEAVADAFEKVEKLRDSGRGAEADAAERVAQELHDEVYRRLCEQNADALNVEADQLFEDAHAEYGERSDASASVNDDDEGEDEDEDEPEDDLD